MGVQKNVKFGLDFQPVTFDALSFRNYAINVQIKMCTESADDRPM